MVSAETAARVSVIASIGSWAIVAGPPTIGLLGNHLTVLRALVIVAAFLGVAILVAGMIHVPHPRQVSEPAAEKA